MTYAFVAPRSYPRRPRIRLEPLQARAIAEPPVLIQAAAEVATDVPPLGSPYVQYAPPWRIDYSRWIPDQPPHGWEQLIASFTNGRDSFIAYPDSSWAEILTAQPDMINAMLYLRYQTERARREAAGQSGDHPVPIYSAALSYRRRYVRSPTSFAELVTHKRQLRRENRKGRYKRWNHLSEVERAARHAAACLEQEQRQAAAVQAQAAQLERTHRSIKRWAKQGLSRNAMVAKLEMRRADALQIIADVLGFTKAIRNLRHLEAESGV